MLLQAPFDPRQVDPTQTGGGFPVGKHPVIIESAELKPTKENDGGYVEFILKIINGPAAGSTGSYRLNLYNKSEKAVNIAYKQLSALCHVTQQFQLGADGRDLRVLFNIPFVIEVGLQKGQEAEGYTEVKKVMDINGNEPGKAPQQQAPAGFGQQPAQQPQAQQQPQQAWGGAPQQQAPQSAQTGGWAAQPQQQPQQAGGSPVPGNGGGWAQPQVESQPQQPAQQGWAQQQPQGQGNPAPSWGQPR